MTQYRINIQVPRIIDGDGRTSPFIGPTSRELSLFGPSKAGFGFLYIWLVAIYFAVLTGNREVTCMTQLLQVLPRQLVLFQVHAALRRLDDLGFHHAGGLFGDTSLLP